MRTATPLLAALVLTACLGPGSGRSEDELTLPSERTGDLFLLQATIGGLGPYALLLDSASSVNLISPDLAAAHPGALRGPGGTISTPGGRVHSQAQLALDSLELGGEEFSPFSAHVVGLDHLSDVLGRRVDGIVGLGPFLDRVLVLDYPASEVRVARRGLDPIDGEEVIALVPRGRLWGVELGGSGRPLFAAIDSAYEGSLVLPESRADLTYQTQPVGSGPPPTTIAGAGAFANLYGHLDVDLMLGSHRLERPLATRLGIETALLGAAILRDFEVRLDPLRGRASFRR